MDVVLKLMLKMMKPFIKIAIWQAILSYIFSLAAGDDMDEEPIDDGDPEEEVTE